MSIEKQYVSFNGDYAGWQFASGVIVPGKRDEWVKEITVRCAYDYNANYAYFTNISLVLEPAETYSYGSKGNPIGRQRQDGQRVLCRLPAPQELHHAQRRRRAKDTDWTQELFRFFNIRPGAADILTG